MGRPPPIRPIDAPGALDAAADALAAGRLVVMPTETVYGIGAALDDEALARLVRAKDRPIDKGLALLVDGLDQVEPIAIPDDDLARLAGRFWPGPLTIVLPRRPGVRVPDLVTGGLGTVGFRSPDVTAVRALARRLGPLALTSANRSGEADATTAEAAAEALGEHVALVLDGGRSPGGVPSTVVALDGGGAFRILRHGALPPEAIAAALGARPGTDGQGG